jgi:hypothetical protein
MALLPWPLRREREDLSAGAASHAGGTNLCTLPAPTAGRIDSEST